MMPIMKILMLHNRYLERGGEDESVEAEIALLRHHGHQVDFLELDNRLIQTRSLLRTGVETVWSFPSYRLVRERIRQSRPDLVHIQNFFPLFSPAVHYAAKAEGKPVVQVLRNYRLLCLNGLFFRENINCEDCLGRFIPWPGILHRCYRQSAAGSAVVAAMLTFHRLLHTWESKVDLFYTLSDFARRKFIQAGMSEKKIAVKPNFVADPGIGHQRRHYALFVGRLVKEKGVLTMLDAWKILDEMKIPLKIVGGGPLEKQVIESTRISPNIEWLGKKDQASVLELMKGARFILFPTQWYETFGRVVIEAFATQTPVVASRIGSAAELISDQINGLLFRAGDPNDLADKVRWAWEHPAEMVEMGRKARREYEEKYTPEKNYQMLMQIYERARAQR